MAKTGKLSEEEILKRRKAAAERALEEAKLRRSDAKTAALPPETGRKGPEPTRYGDWEKKGIVSDF
jgi:hypothetical protein